MGSLWNTNSFHNETSEYGALRMMRKTTRLHYAAHDGDCVRIESLLAVGFDIEARDGYGRTPLLRAALNGHIDAFDLLLRYGADFNAEDDWGRKAEHLAVKNGHWDLFCLILDLGGEGVLYSRDNFGRTPAHLASLKGERDTLSAIVSSKFNINVKDNWHRTPLHLAYKSENEETATFLKEKGADNKCVDLFGRKPEDM
ncbi:hypothetical protein R5R35_011896 [Gryllus longicercus]|uniref:Ankyrin repeat protein n=1 Tax=Gryllus longicercus TaxID=2509291 RepID=A0AAN9W1E2_9ORTH